MGTLVVPTFTYSFCRGEEFDGRHTPSVAGTFTEFVRSQEGVVRSADPIFSVAAIGYLAHEVTRIRERTCFGPGSVFELLEQAGVKFLLVGTDYQKSLTYFIHLEKLFGVPYREDKLFSGSMVMNNGTRKHATFSYYVRTETSGCRMNYNRVGFEFDEMSGCRLVRFAYGLHRLISGAELRRYGIARLKEDAYCLTRSKGKEPESESKG
jgi:aminoglycoside 3-N-acetyltransferase